MARRPRTPRVVFKKGRNLGVSLKKLGEQGNSNLSQAIPSPSSDTQNKYRSSEVESAFKKKLGDLDKKYTVCSHEKCKYNC